MKIYGDDQSGNCLKVRYTADFLDLKYQWIPVDILQGEAKSPEFLHLNPAGQVPLITLEDGRTIAQSNAIIRYLAQGSVLLPEDAFEQAKIDEWLFWEQYSHEPYIAVCRFHMQYLKRSKESRSESRVQRGEQALDFMDNHLVASKWLTRPGFSIADISLLAYTRLADEGGFDLAARSNVCRWIADCENQLEIAARI